MQKPTPFAQKSTVLSDGCRRPTKKRRVWIKCTTRGCTVARVDFRSDENWSFRSFIVYLPHKFARARPIFVERAPRADSNLQNETKKYSPDPCYPCRGFSPSEGGNRPLLCRGVCAFVDLFHLGLRRRVPPHRRRKLCLCRAPTDVLRLALARRLCPLGGALRFVGLPQPLGRRHAVGAPAHRSGVVH